MKKTFFSIQTTFKNQQNLKVPKKFTIEKLIYVNENEFERIKNINKEPNQNLKKILKKV